MRLSIGVTVLLFMGVGCNEAALKASGPVVRDSSGITVVENPDPSAFDTLSWRADTSRIVRIGALEGDGPNVFGRIGGVARLSDGRIVVADAEAHEIRFFAPDGSFLSRTGRRGGGPGEYEYFSGMIDRKSVV